IGDCFIRTKQCELVSFVSVYSQIVDQSRVINRESFPVWRFDIDHQLGFVSRDRIQARPQFLRFTQVDRPRRLLRISEMSAVTNHLTLITSGEKREAPWAR